MKTTNTELKPDIVYSKKKNYVFIEFKTMMPDKYSYQKRAQLKEFEKSIILKTSTKK